MSLSKREARRKRDREDFARVQATQATGMKGAAFKIPPGPTYREHIEDKLKAATTRYREQPDGDPVLRGVIRGLAMALALYEDSYNYSTQRVRKIERDFLED